MRWLIALVFVSNFTIAADYHFVSISGLIEQEVGRIVLPRIYQKIDIDITITPMPGKRAQFEATTGHRDGEIMRIYSYGEENPGMLRVPTPYYYLETTAFSLSNSDIVVNSAEDLAKYVIVKVRGVKHTNNITAGLEGVVDLNSTRQIMMFIKKRRADIALTNTIDGLMAIKELNITNIKPVGPPLARLKLYHYLHKKTETYCP